MRFCDILEKGVMFSNVNSYYFCTELPSPSLDLKCGTGMCGALTIKCTKI